MQTLYQTYRAKAYLKTVHINYSTEWEAPDTQLPNTSARGGGAWAGEGGGRRRRFSRRGNECHKNMLFKGITSQTKARLRRLTVMSMTQYDFTSDTYFRCVFMARHEKIKSAISDKHVDPLIPWVSKTEFLLETSIQHRASNLWECRKLSIRI